MAGPLKLRIDNDALAEEFFDGTRLIGIVAPIKDYQLCWRLNQVLRFNFRNNNELEIQLSKKNRKYFFAIYEYNEPGSSIKHYLYNNQFDGEYLLPELKHLDFLWLIAGEAVGDAALNSLQQSIRTINGVQLVMELKVEKIKNKQHLIF
ncbi:MAG TPA: IPExxxVDY family protein [Chitinophagaceae bacterium]|nr:IPExxxVDY family protein [Chitinophagaceae bacterium]